MSEKKQVTTTTVKPTAQVKPATPVKPVRTAITTSLFDKQNLMLMLLGVAVIAIGMLLMVGGASKDPSVFNRDEVYSHTRITVAPILIIIGLGIEIYAIFKKPKT